MVKPSNNNSLGGNQPGTDEDTDEEPQDDGSTNGSSHALSAINVNLQQQLTDERKKRVRAERAIAKLKTKLEKSEATRVACGIKLRGEISGLKLKETAAVTAASTSSKILGDASKEVISTKSECIRDLRKQISEQLKAISDGKALQGKVDRLKAEVEGFVVEKTLWTKEKKSITKSNESLEKKLDLQITAKFAHQQKMAEIALDGKRVGLEQSKQRLINTEDKHNTILEGKKELARFNHKKRDESKIADQNRKEEAKSKKAKAHADRIQVVSSEMLRSSRLNGGSFPSPGLNLEEAYAQLQVAANAPPPAAMRQMTMTQAYDTDAGPYYTPLVHAPAMPPCAPLRQTTMTQAYEDPNPLVPPPGPLVLPPGWQAYSGEDKKVLYFHEATGQFEASLDDLFKKKKQELTTTRSAPPPMKKPELTTRRRSAPSAHITPDAARKTPPPRTDSPRPDAAISCSIVINSPTRKITITRVPGVIDLMTSGPSSSSSEDDEETDLEFRPKTLPATCDFARPRALDSASDSTSDSSEI
jgi:hypothetical protein